jgi:predicted nucleotidyltransferase
MTKKQILQVLQEHLPELRTRLGVHRLALYGSFARGAPSEHSDVDILVELEAPLGLRFVELAEEELERLLSRKVDLATVETFRRSWQDPRRRHMAESVERDLVYVEESRWHRMTRRERECQG